jgi:hypothetical protein
MSKPEAFLLAAVALAFASMLAALVSRVTLDDAYITFRYARHLADGYGLGAWNHIGERVEGYSSLLWTLLLAGAARLSIDIHVGSKVLGAGAALVTLAALIGRPDDRPAFLTGVFLAVYVPFVLYAVSGMEAVGFTALVTLTLVGPAACQPLVASLLIALRPEGVLVAGIDALALACHTERRRWAIPTAVAGALTFVAIAIFRWATYHTFAPNTYYAKVAGGGFGHLKLGFGYAGSWMAAHAVVVALAAVGTVTARRRDARRALTCVLLVTLYTAYVVMAGGDPPTAFPFWRHFVHIAPAWILLGMTGLTMTIRDRRWLQVAAAIVVALAANAGAFLIQNPGSPRERIADYISWLDALSTPTTTISSSYAGALPFTVDAVHIDALGLNTPYIAHHGTFDPDGPQDSKTDMGWVIEQRPDIVEGYLSGSALLRGASPDEIVGIRRRKMILEMVSSPRFQRDYVFVRNAPYDRMDRALFLRRDFWAAHPRRDTLDCVPVQDTALARFARR